MGELWLGEAPTGVRGGLTLWVLLTVSITLLVMGVELWVMLGLGAFENCWALYWIIIGELGSVSTGASLMWSC